MNSQDSISLSIVVPAYNEEDGLEFTLSRILEDLEQIGITEYEVLVFNDGSQDRTGEIADAFGQRDGRVKVFHFPENRGVGTVLQEGFKAARHTWLTIIPGDGQFVFSSLKDFLPLTDTFDVICGYYTNQEVRPLRRRAVSYFYLKFLHLLYGVRVPYTNGMWLIRTQIVQSIPVRSTGHTSTAEIIVKAGLKGYKVGAAPFILRESTNPTSSVFKIRSVINIFKGLSYLYLYKIGLIKK